MSKLLRPAYYRMYEVMRVRLGKNLGRCIFTILLFNLVQSFFLSLTMSPLMAAAKTGLNATTFALSAISTIFIFFLSYQFLYGILNFFTKLMLARKDVMRVLSSGFRDRTRRAHFVSAFFSFLLVLSALVATAVLFYNRETILAFVTENFTDEKNTAENIQFIKAVGLAVVFCAVFFGFEIFISIPFLFSWNILFDDKKISAPKALKKSFSLMIRNYFHFIGFVIYCCLKNVISIILIFVINMFLNARQSGISNFFSMLLGFFAFTQEYTIIAKAYTSIPIYYYSLLSINGLIQTEKKENESPAQ